MKICIIDAPRKLGQNMVQHCLDKGYEVAGVCRTQSIEKLRRATTLSAELIQEVMAADLILIDTSMYYFTVLSARSVNGTSMATPAASRALI